MTVIEQAADETAPPVADDGLCHTVCCRDYNRSLCGLDVTAEPWDDTPQLCIVCEHDIAAKACRYQPGGVCLGVQR